MKLDLSQIQKIESLHKEGKTTKEIADSIGLPFSVVFNGLKTLGLKQNKKYRSSCGSDKVLELLKSIFPNFKVIKEFHLGEQLFLDFYIKELHLAIEFDGRQHDEYVPFFHGTRDKFKHQCNLDKKKEEICRIRKITIVRIKHSEEKNLSYRLLMDKMISTINGAE